MVRKILFALMATLGATFPYWLAASWSLPFSWTASKQEWGMAISTGLLFASLAIIGWGGITAFAVFIESMDKGVRRSMIFKRFALAIRYFLPLIYGTVMAVALFLSWSVEAFKHVIHNAESIAPILLLLPLAMLGYEAQRFSRRRNFILALQHKRPDAWKRWITLMALVQSATFLVLWIGGSLLSAHLFSMVAGSSDFPFYHIILLLILTAIPCLLSLAFLFLESYAHTRKLIPWHSGYSWKLWLENAKDQPNQ
ncbi:hypothetical protein [Pontibacter sp. G13]|uniref:hypothetical protein n=1 Tax=Pontibacter sp. G13 TaxID=3074898 RepID=UPI00288B5405|nr:hypothetical protein [Pontibacter sp. G13]WNJ17651.1 hypothetical protein RJD25_22600 [Pontibacter sp. G13]